MNKQKKFIVLFIVFLSIATVFIGYKYYSYYFKFSIEFTYDEEGKVDIEEMYGSLLKRMRVKNGEEFFIARCDVSYWDGRYEKNAGPNDFNLTVDLDDNSYVGGVEVLVRRKKKNYDKYRLWIARDRIKLYEFHNNYIIDDKKVIGNNITGSEIIKFIDSIDFKEIKENIDIKGINVVWVELDDVEINKETREEFNELMILNKCVKAFLVTDNTFDEIIVNTELNSRYIQLRLSFLSSEEKGYKVYVLYDRNK